MNEQNPRPDEDAAADDVEGHKRHQYADEESDEGGDDVEGHKRIRD